MNKTPSEESPIFNDELLPEYCFDYQTVKPNRFAVRAGNQGLKIVVLDKDVAQVFTTPESVNKVLRVLIEAMPQSADCEQSKRMFEK